MWGCWVVFDLALDLDMCLPGGFLLGLPNAALEWSLTRHVEMFSQVSQANSSL